MRGHALIFMSAVTMVTSIATLAVVLVGAKRMQEELDEVKNKTASTINKIKLTLQNLDD